MSALVNEPGPRCTSCGYQFPDWQVIEDDPCLWHGFEGLCDSCFEQMEGAALERLARAREDAHQR